MKDLRNLIIDCHKGLAYAHSLGLFHFDIKPANIFVFLKLYLKKYGRRVFKIADFGGSPFIQKKNNQEESKT